MTDEKPIRQRNESDEREGVEERWGMNGTFKKESSRTV